jgi:hypothetical protein
MDMHEDNNPNEVRFEQELRTAMGRVNAPETLERFLMIAAEAETARTASGKAVVQHGRILAFRKPPVWFGAAVAAALVVSVFTGEGLRLHREHIRAAEADRQFEQSEEITQHALDHAREQLQRAGISLDQ